MFSAMRQSVHMQLLCICCKLATEMSKIDLVFAKSRLAPLKGMTVPRLELMAVLIGVRCLQFVKEQLKLDIVKTYLWTDSQCVLGWLTTERKLDVFVRNRVMEIKGKDIVFNYVNTKENPADIATRGTSVKELSDHRLWWHGPEWLHALDEHEPDVSVADDEHNCEFKEDLEETVNIAEVTASNDTSKESTAGPNPPFDIDSERYSSITKLFRVTALASRFIKRLRKLPTECKYLTSAELNRSGTLVVDLCTAKTLRRGNWRYYQWQVNKFATTTGTLH